MTKVNHEVQLSKNFGSTILEHLQQLLQICVLFRERAMTFNFYLLTFSNTLPTDSLSHSLSHLNIISSFIVYSFFNHHLFFF